MESLEALPNIAKLNDFVIRILGQNLGKFTLQGTNTYLVGRHPPFILIDTGEGRDEYPPLCEAVLRQSREETPTAADAPVSLVSDIIVTHRHRDHYGGLPSVLGVLRKLHDEANAGLDYVRPRIHKYPSPRESDDSTHEKDLQSVLSSLDVTSYLPAPSGSPIHDLSDLQKLETSDGTVSLEILHTPGHTPDSICLLLRDKNDVDRHSNILFTADSVLGQGTAVFEDLSAYLQSLQRLLALREDQPAKVAFESVYPGHGPAVDDGPGLISTYIKHRYEREEQIIDVLSRPPPATEGDDTEGSPSWTIWTIVGQIYKDYPENLWLPAAHGVELHLKKLEKDGRAKYIGGEGINQRWVLLSRL